MFWRSFLVGGLVAINFYVPIYIYILIGLRKNHPNWRTHIFSRGGPTTKQSYIGFTSLAFRGINPQGWPSWDDRGEIPIYFVLTFQDFVSFVLVTGLLFAIVCCYILMDFIPHIPLIDWAFEGKSSNLLWHVPPPDRWGSLDFNKGATPPPHPPMPLPAPDAVVHSWTTPSRELLMLWASARTPNRLSVTGMCKC